MDRELVLLAAMMAWDHERHPGETCSWDVRGVVVEGDLPEVPPAVS